MHVYVSVNMQQNNTATHSFYAPTDLLEMLLRFFFSRSPHFVLAYPARITIYLARN